METELQSISFSWYFLLVSDSVSTILKPSPSPGWNLVT